jgi:two-component system, chemotaxis family, protein-glutamate methylesterase/glutaminase
MASSIDSLAESSVQIPLPRSKPFGWPRVLTVFLKSMAEHWTGRPVAVVLSGAGSDGADALESIKAAGGVTFVQKRETAAHPDMPQNALATGFVDFELSPEDIAQELVRIGSEKRIWVFRSDDG